ncbi:long-chain fatty acid--CoA ligase, partial [Rhizobium ruizarguesonis]
RRFGIPVVPAVTEAFNLAAAGGEAELPSDTDKIFLICFTSGTTAEPKAYYRSWAHCRRRVFELENDASPIEAPAPLLPRA